MSIRHFAFVVFSLAAGCSLFGSRPSPPTNLGQSGVYSFKYLFGLFGYAPSSRLCSNGAQISLLATLENEADRLAKVRIVAVESSDPSVARFELGGGAPLVSNGEDGQVIDVVTGHAGTTDLTLISNQGGTLDKLTVTVEDPTELRFVEMGWSESAELRFVAGASEWLPLLPVSGGHDLLGGGGCVRFSFDGPLEAVGDLAPAAGVIFAGTQPGQGRVILDAASVHRELSVDVVDPGELSLELTPASLHFAAGESRDVTLTTRTGAGQLVDDVSCDWDLPPGLTVSRTLNSGPGTTALHTFSGERGHYTAICNAGAGTTGGYTLGISQTMYVQID
jgi:hypothetical protein